MVVADARSWRSGGVWLVLLCVAVYVPGLFNLPPVDRDESRFAQASRQMFEAAALPREKLDPAMHGGGWAVPMVQGVERLNKPPLIYWVQVCSGWVFTAGDPLRDAVWMYRVPSALAAVFSVLGTWRIGCRMFDPRAAWIGAAMLAMCPMVAWDAHQARADQLLLATVVAAQGCLWVVWKRTDGGRALRGGTAGKSGTMGWAVLFWVSIAAGVMAKGPITPLIAGLTVAMLGVVTGRWRWVRALRVELGLPLAVLMIAPWVMAVADHKGGLGAYATIVWNETIGRSTTPKEGHWGPPGYHTVLLPILLWPGSLMLAPALWLAVKRGWPRKRARAGAVTGMSRARRPDETVDLEVVEASTPRWWQRREGRGAELFLLAWILPAWVVFEAIGTKLPHYPMPLYPAVALLCGRALLVAEEGGVWWLGRKWAVRALNGWVVLGIGLCVALLAVSFFAFWETALGSGTAPFGAVFAFGAAAMIGWAWMRMRAGTFVGAWRWAAGACVVLLLGLNQFVLPPVLGFSERLTAELERHGGDVGRGERPVALVGYHEDSMLFLTRGKAQRVGGDREHLEAVKAWMEANQNGLVVVPAEWWDKAWVWKSAGDRSETIRAGFNIAKGRIEKLVILERER